MDAYMKSVASTGACCEKAALGSVSRSLLYGKAVLFAQGTLHYVAVSKTSPSICVLKVKLFSMCWDVGM